MFRQMACVFLKFKFCSWRSFMNPKLTVVLFLNIHSWLRTWMCKLLMLPSKINVNCQPEEPLCWQEPVKPYKHSVRERQRFLLTIAFHLNLGLKATWIESSTKSVLKWVGEVKSSKFYTVTMRRMTANQFKYFWGWLSLVLKA